MFFLSQLKCCFQERLNGVRDELISRRYGVKTEPEKDEITDSPQGLGFVVPPRFTEEDITSDDLVVGALEAAFLDMVGISYFLMFCSDCKPTTFVAF